MILGHNNRQVLDAVIRRAENGLSFGAATEIEVEMAEFITSRIPSVEMIRMVNSGTEAVMSAIRAARGYTGERPDREIRRLLPWPFRRPAGEGGLRRHDRRCAGKPGRAPGLHKGYADGGIQQSGERGGPV